MVFRRRSAILALTLSALLMGLGAVPEQALGQLYNYPGRSPNADWRDAAQDRIEQHRKAPLEVTVLDADGNPVDGAGVDVQMQQHEFNFGTAINSDIIREQTSPGEPYRKNFLDTFNYGTIETRLKVYRWEGNPNVQDDVRFTIDWLNDQGYGARGHAALWENWWWNNMHEGSEHDYRDLTGQEIDDRIKGLIRDRVSEFAGEVRDWDMQNHPKHRKEIRRHLASEYDMGWDETVPGWWEVARNNDETANMGINEQNIVQTYGSSEWNGWRGDYEWWISNFLPNNGVQVDNIGMMAHAQLGRLTGIPEVLKVYDRFGQYAPIYISELHITYENWGNKTWTDGTVLEKSAQADYLRDFLTASFSHPDVETVVHWTFWEGAAWRGTSALYEGPADPNDGMENWELRDHGQEWRRLIYQEWWTDDQGQTNAQGTYETDGFKGNYEVAVSDNGRTRIVPATLSDGGTSIEVSGIRPLYGSEKDLALGGGDDFVRLERTPSINTDGPFETRTVDLWFKAATVEGGTPQTLYEEGGSSTGFNIFIKGQELYAGVWNEQDEDTLPSLGKWAKWFSTSQVEAGTWHHVALVYDEPNDRLRAYLDGEPFGSATPGGEVASHPDDNGIGNRAGDTNFANQGNVNSPFEGRIDQVRVWDAGFSDQEVRTWMRQTVSEPLGREDLLAAYRFNERTLDATHSVNTVYEGGSAQFTASGAPLGQLSDVVADGAGSVGSVSVDVTSETEGDAVQLYQFGDPNGQVQSVASDAAESRLHLVWGLASVGGSPSADVTLDFSGAEGVEDPSAVKLLKREAPTQPWVDVTSDWTRDGRSFTKENVSSFSEFAVGGSLNEPPQQGPANGHFSQYAAEYDGAADGGTPDGGGGTDKSVIDGTGLVSDDGPYPEKTVEFWFNADNIPSSGTAMLWTQGTAGTSGINVYLDNGDLYAGFWDSNLSNQWFSTSSVQANTWHHVAIVFDGPNNTATAYLDGESFGTTSLSGNALSGSDGEGKKRNTIAGIRDGLESKLHSGNLSGGATVAPFDGTIDQFRLWNGVLSQQEVRSRMSRPIDVPSFGVRVDKRSSIGTIADRIGSAWRFETSGGSRPNKFDNEYYVGAHSTGGPFWDDGFGEGSFGDSDIVSTTAPIGPTIADGGPDGGSGSFGESGATITADVAPDDTVTVSAYGSKSGDFLAGRDSEEDFSQVSVPRRANVVWQIYPQGHYGEGSGATLGAPIEVTSATINFSQVNGIEDAGKVELLHRPSPGEQWENVTSEWTLDAQSETFTLDGTLQDNFDPNSSPSELGQFAIGVKGLRISSSSGGDWSDPATWSADEVTPDNVTPESGDSVTTNHDVSFPNTSGASVAALDVASALTTGADLTVSDVLTLTSGTFDVTSGSLTLTSEGESSSARIAGSGSGSINGEVTAERTLDRKDGSASDSHWRFVASPVDAALDDAGGGGAGSTFNGSPLLSNTWTQGEGMTGANFQGSGTPASVFYYDEAAPVGSDASRGWDAVDDLTNLTGEEGFAVFLFEDQDYDGSAEGFPRTLTATGPVADENTGTDVTLPVTCNDNDGSNTGSDGCNDGYDGWNLVANPFLSHFDWYAGAVSKTNLDGPAYIYDSDNDRYQLTDGTNSNGGDPFIAPFQAVFVKASADNGDEGNVALSVNSGAKADPSSSGDREFKSTEKEPLVSLQLSDGTQAEETRITYRDGAEASKDRFDGYQLTPLSGDYHLLASEMEGRPALFDSQYRPAPAEADTIALALDVTEGGTYTLGTDTLRDLPSGWNVILENTDSGARWDLGAGQSASLEVEAAQSTSAAEETSPAALLKGGPAVAKASTDGDLPSYRLYVGPAAALPVELASLEARVEGTDVQLSWQTASETGNAGFAIERRAEGGSWSQIGFREGAGTTEQARTYRFTDTGVPFEAEQVRYRLRQEDVGGATTLSDEVTVELGAPPEARLHAPFPNPSAQQATVRFEVPRSTDVEIAVYDVLGRRVETIVNGQVPAGREQRSVQTGQLAPGTYFIRMRMGETVQTERLTVVR